MTDAQVAYFGNQTFGPSPFRTLPILHTPTIQTTAASPRSPMDIAEVTPPASAVMGPPSRTSPEDANGQHDHSMNIGLGAGLGDSLTVGNNGPNAAVAAAAGSQQPKVVQTAFIHKLYKYVRVRLCR